MDGHERLEQAKQQLGELLPWARVATVARCAERAIPLLTLPENISSLPAQSLEKVRNAVACARKAALTGQLATANHAESAASVSRLAHPLAQRAELAAGDDRDVAYARSRHLYAGAFTASAGVYAARAASASDANLEHCETVLSKTYGALAYLSRVTADSLGSAILDDISWLQKQSLSADSKIPNEFFERPLWPLGEPEGWMDRIVKAGGSLLAENRSSKAGCSAVVLAYFFLLVVTLSMFLLEQGSNISEYFFCATK